VFEEVRVVSTTGLARQWGVNCWVDGGEGKIKDFGPVNTRVSARSVWERNIFVVFKELEMSCSTVDEEFI
jgi:hypothetical protein